MNETEKQELLEKKYQAHEDSFNERITSLEQAL